VETKLPEIPFRLAIVGAGAVTREMHLRGALESRRVLVSALVDPVTARAERLAWDFGISPKIAARVEDIVKDVDGAMIATPNNTHRAIAVSCLEAGVPCLIEKPLATTVADAQAICAAAEAAGKVVAVGYTTRFRDEVVLLKELLESRYFGRVTRYHYQEGSVGGWTPASGFIADRHAAGGGVLVGTGTHFINRMLYWFGYPESCRLVDDSRGGPDSHCVASFRNATWGDEFNGTLLLSKTVPLKAGLVIEAERGTIIFPMGRAPLHFMPRGESRIRTVIARNGTKLFSTEKSDSQMEIENFVDACGGKAAPMVDGHEALLSVKLIEELYQHRTQLAETWNGSVGAAGV
jgi:predicted dehydrogenase